MIPQKLRLPKNRISYLLKKGKKLGTPHLVVKFLAPPKISKAENRFCVVVSAKVEPLAVKRNKLRRQIYEIIRLNHNLIIRPSDIMLIARPSLKTVNYNELKELIVSLFKKL